MADKCGVDVLKVRYLFLQTGYLLVSGLELLLANVKSVTGQVLLGATLIQS